MTQIRCPNNKRLPHIEVTQVQPGICFEVVCQIQ